jgi:TonB family protein
MAMTNLLLILLAASAPAVGPRPTGSPQNWVTDDDYPAEALRAGQHGTVAFRLDLDAAGAVTGCTVTSSSGSALLDARTCELLRLRGRFVPARDRKGRAIASGWSARFTWRLGSDEGTSARGFNVTTYELRPDGTILSCRTINEHGFAIERDPCLADRPKPAWLAKYAPAYRILRVQTGYDQIASPPALPGADWGILISRRLAVMGVSGPPAVFVECNVVASEGPPDIGSEVCPLRPAGQSAPAPVTARVIEGWAIYGVRREPK